MIGRDSILYSLRNLNHRKGRSFLTVFSILVGIATIFIFISFGLGLYEYVDSFTTGSSADKLLIMAKGAGVPGLDDSIKITEDDLRVVLRSDGIIDATPLYYDVAKVEKGKESKYAYITSYDPKHQEMVFELFQAGIEKGRFLSSGDSGVVLLGYNYMLPNKIFERPFEINEKVEINGEKFKIIGFIEAIGNPQDDSNIYVTNDQFEKMFPDKDTYAEIIAKAEINNMEQTIYNVEKNLRKERGLDKGKEDFYVQSFEDLIESFSGALNIIIGFIILIAFISIIVSAVNTINTMITSVLERYKEIGILKSIGARNSEIFGIFLFESAFLGLLAGVLGVLLGWGITSLANVILENLGWGFLSPSTNILIFIGCILFAVFTGAISGVVPAIRAARTNTVDALRYE